MIHHPHSHMLTWAIHLPKILAFIALDIATMLIVRHVAESERGELVLAVGTAAFVCFYLFLVIQTGRMLRDPDSKLAKALILSHTSQPQADKWSHLVGKTGVTITELRPSGSIEVDGERISVVAEGTFIHAGVPVVIVDAAAYRTVVRPCPAPTDTDA